MTFQIRKAERKKAKLKLGVSGPSGSGKTFSSLLLAYGLTGDWNKIVLIDTENGSGELYVNHGPIGEYNYLRLDAPFSPERYQKAIQAVVSSGAEAIVIDSISHEWDGKGGCLDIHSDLGGKFENWKKVTPMHQGFINSILEAPCHVVVTMRKKQDYDMSKGSDGRAKVTKVGMKEIQRDGFEYELTVNFDVEISHYATASKDRTGVFMPRPTFKITAETGKELLAWAESGATAKPVENPKPQTTTATNTSQTAVSSPTKTLNQSLTNTSEGKFEKKNETEESPSHNTFVQSHQSTESSQTSHDFFTKASTTKSLEELRQDVRKLYNEKGWSRDQFIEILVSSFAKNNANDLTRAELESLLEFHS